MKKLILLIAAFYSLKTWSTVDYSFKGTFRSYPLGAAVTADMGYGYKFWGKSEVLYGYLRPNFIVQTSGLVNYASLKMDFYPISFLGFTLGKTYGVKSIDELQGFNCSEIKCDNDVDRVEYEVNLALAGKGFSFLNIFKKFNFSNKTEDNFFAEEFSNLVGYADDRLTSNTTVLGYNLNENLMFGFLHMFNEMNSTNQQSKMSLLISNYKRENTSYLLGVGNFNNRNDHNHLSILFEFKWTGSKGVRLF